MSFMPKNAAGHRYTVRFLVSMSFYVLFIFLVKRAFQHLHPTGVMAYGLAVLPALPILATLVVVGMYLVEEQDEFQRNILVQSMLWGLGLSMAILTVWGFLEVFVGVSHFPSYLAYPLFWGLVGLVSPVLKLRYR